MRIEFFRDEFEPRHVGASHADAGERPEDEGGDIIVGIEGEQQIGDAGPEGGDDEDVAGVESIGERAEDDAGGDVAQLVDGEDRTRHGVVHPPFLLEDRQDRGVVDEHQHDEDLGQAQGKKPACLFRH